MVDTYLICIKGYGDLVIALNALCERGDSSPNIGVVTGEYLRPLALKLLPDANYIFIPILEYPEIYNLRKLRLIKAIKNLFRLFFYIKNQIRVDKKFILDDINIREKILFGRYGKMISVKRNGENNIYKDYQSILIKYSEKKILKSNKKKLLKNIYSNKILIFPASRVNSKRIDLNVVNLIYTYLKNKGYDLEVVFHKSDKVNFNEAHITKYYENYSELDFYLSQSLFVVTSDSFISHYADFYGIKVFVVDYRNNYYFLPIQSINKGWFFSGFNSEKLDQVIEFCQNERNICEGS